MRKLNKLNFRMLYNDWVVALNVIYHEVISIFALTVNGILLFTFQYRYQQLTFEIVKKSTARVDFVSCFTPSKRDSYSIF